MGEGRLWQARHASHNEPVSLEAESLSAVGAAGAVQASGAAEEEDGEAEEDEGTKAELKLGKDSTLLFKEPAKLFFKGKDGVRLNH